MVQTCPTDLIPAPRALIWELVTQPARMTWMDATLVGAPNRRIQPGDELRLSAGPLGAFSVRWTVGEMREGESLAIHIELPFGIVNEERVELRDAGSGLTRVTLN